MKCFPKNHPSWFKTSKLPTDRQKHQLALIKASMLTDVSARLTRFGDLKTNLRPSLRST